MAQMNEVTKRALPKGFKVLLGVSLALNLAVIGVIAGAMLRTGPDGPPNRGGGNKMGFARPYIQALPREDRHAIFEVTRSKTKGLDRASRRAQYQKVTDILRAETFDRTAAEAVLSLQAASTLNAQSAAQTQWMNVIEKMNVQERRSYADAIEEILKRGPESKRKPKPD